MELFDVEKVRGDFPILEREVYNRPLVYLDNAATAQKPRAVMEAMDGMMSAHNGNIHRGVHLLSEESTAAYEAARETVRAFIGAESTEEVVFTSGATAGLNLAARSLTEMLVSEGDNVIVSRLEHHSNIVPWQLALNRRGEIRVLELDGGGLPDLEMLEDLIDDRTRILAISQCSNVLGVKPNLRKAIEIAHRHGVVVVVDGCQGIVHGGVDVRELDCDIYAFSAHKLYGPTGIGGVYGKKALFSSLPPYFGGGDMVKSVNFGHTSYADLPFRFEAGTANFIGAVGMAAAIDYLRRFDAAAIARHEDSLRARAERQLLEIDGLTIYGTGPDKAPIVSFNINGIHPLDIGMVLDKQGVAIRTGTHCAQPLVESLGASSVCRASFALYNTDNEVDMFVEALKKAVKMLR